MSLAMLPDAPGRLSMMIGWPSAGSSFSASMRIMVSMTPPEERASTKRIGRAG